MSKFFTSGFHRGEKNIIWSRLGLHVVWVAVFQRNILAVFLGGCLRMEVVCFCRTVSTPYDLVSMWKDNI